MNKQTDEQSGRQNQPAQTRVGVIFGGRSSEHEVSLSSAQNVMQALREAGYEVVPIGIAPSGRWLTGKDPHRQLLEAGRAQAAHVESAGHANGRYPSMLSDGAQIDADPARSSWGLLPQSHDSQNGLAQIDVIFPVLHGPFGEDGTIQGMLEMAALPYVGCGVLTSSVAMDKAVAKRLLAAEGIPQAESALIQRRMWQTEDNAESICDHIEAKFSYPVFVKPANLGSSIGVSKVRDRAQLVAAIDLAAEFDRKILVEAAVPHAREIEVSVLGNHAPIASVPGEVIPGHEFYDYEAKYIDDSSSLIIPADLTPEQVQMVQQMALTAFQAIDAEGLARVDFLMNGETGEFFLNEINTMPGFTRSSMYPKLWEASGIAYPELVHRLVQLALERFEERSRNRTSREVS